MTLGKTSNTHAESFPLFFLILAAGAIPQRLCGRKTVAWSSMSRESKQQISLRAVGARHSHSCLADFPQAL